MKLNTEQIRRAMACKSVDELLALAKAEGVELARDEAEKYFAQFSEQSLKLEDLRAVTGGADCPGYMCVDCQDPI